MISNVPVFVGQWSLQTTDDLVVMKPFLAYPSRLVCQEQVTTGPLHRPRSRHKGLPIEPKMVRSVVWFGSSKKGGQSWVRIVIGSMKTQPSRVRNPNTYAEFSSSPPPTHTHCGRLSAQGCLRQSLTYCSQDFGTSACTVPAPSLLVWND